MLVLVTGGAGFIGSSLVHALVRLGADVRVVDDLSTGYAGNLPAEASLTEADVADVESISKAMTGVEVGFHLAALRAVLRSVEDPLSTDRTNTHGTLAFLQAAVNAGTRRVVCASSSSVYGGAVQLPTPEEAPTTPKSPYAVSKLAGELYTRVFAELYGIESLSLRYFNVYGPRQRPDSAYAAVIPLFIDALVGDRSPVVHGDGRQTRSFTYVDDAVAANLAAASAPSASCRGQSYNVAGSERNSVLDLLTILGRLLGTAPAPAHVEPRPGDVRHSHADISAAATHLGYRPTVGLEEGLRRTVEWFTGSGAGEGDAAGHSN